MRTRLAPLGLAALLAAALAPTAFAPTALAGPSHTLLLPSARENTTLSEVTLPLYQGTSHGQPVWYVVTDASTREAATAFGVNYAPKLARAANTSGVQQVQMLGS